MSCSTTLMTGMYMQVPVAHIHSISLVSVMVPALCHSGNSVLSSMQTSLSDGVCT